MQNKIHVKYCSLLYLLDRMIHCVKSVQIRRFFWSIFSCILTEYSVRIQENTDQKKTPYLDTFHAVIRNYKNDEKDFFLHIVHFPWCCLGKFLPARIFFSHRNQEATTIKISLVLVICTFMLVVFISLLMTFEDFRSSNHYVSFLISAAF